MHEYCKEDWTLFDESVKRNEKSINRDIDEYLWMKKQGKKQTKDSLFKGNYLGTNTLCFILCNRVEKGKQCAEAALEFVNIAIHRKSRGYLGKTLSQETATFLLHYWVGYLKWVLTGKEDLEAWCIALEAQQKEADRACEKKSRYKKLTCLDAIEMAMRVDRFDIAEEYLARIYKPKKRQCLSLDTIYDKFSFYYYIILYLNHKDEHPELLQPLKECFQYYFQEVLLGNRSLNKDYNMMPEKIFIGYLWYKYFCGTPYEEISPITVIQSIKYGLK